VVELRRITDDNFRTCIDLEVAEGQDAFVAPNLYTLAEAYVMLTNDECIPMPFAIYHDDEMVGFIAMAYQRGEGEQPVPFYEMYRFMVDKRHQGKGYGRAALSRAIEYLKTQPLGQGSYIATSFVPGNDVAKDLFVSLGFVETGEYDGEELVAHYQL